MEDQDYASQRGFVDSVESWSTNEVKINWISSLAWVVSFLQGEFGYPQSDKLLYGDFDGNKKVEVTDLTYLSMYFLGDYSLSVDTLKAADVNGDGTLNIADLAHLKQYVSKDPVTLGPQ